MTTYWQTQAMSNMVILKFACFQASDLLKKLKLTEIWDSRQLPRIKRANLIHSLHLLEQHTPLYKKHIKFYSLPELDFELECFQSLDENVLLGSDTAQNSTDEPVNPKSTITPHVNNESHTLVLKFGRFFESPPAVTLELYTQRRTFLLEVLYKFLQLYWVSSSHLIKRTQRKSAHKRSLCRADLIAATFKCHMVVIPPSLLFLARIHEYLCPVARPHTRL